MTRVLVVDDDADLLQILTIRIRRAGYEVRAVADGKTALQQIDVFRPHVVLADLRMEGMDGMMLLKNIKASQPTLPVLMLTAHGTIPDAVAAVAEGAFAFLTKPFDPEVLLAKIEEAAVVAGGGAQSGDGVDDLWRTDIVTQSGEMEELLKEAKLAARADVNIVIQGESGTGKEILAKAIHRASARRERPFVGVNCTAIPETLFESEVFGFAKGSFSGATHDRKGLFQAADGGTLFLDEIGDVPMHCQAKLLRAIQEREVRPLGTQKAVPVDVRIIAATHRDLEDAVAAGQFREDLYYRLNVVSLELPPLSRRREDIPILCEIFLRAASHKGRARAFSVDAKAKLIAASWPGNVRQLQNVVEQCVVLSDGALISAALVERALRGKGTRPMSLSEARDRFERDYLIDLLRATDGKVALAARLAGRNRSEFYKLLARHELTPDAFRNKWRSQEEKQEEASG